MALDELIATIDQLREKMKDHTSDLSKSEAMTRYVLIDPLLAALGWDTSDPPQVQPEYETGAGEADYVLLKADGTPAVFVEAKSLDSPLSKGLRQGINYCVEKGTRYFAITNGRKWAVYNIYREGTIEEKRVSGFDISGPSSVAAFSALGLLWKPLLDEAGPSLPVMLAEADLPASEQASSRVSLDEFRTKKGASPPKRLFLPEGQQIDLSSWKDFLVEIALHLINTDKLNSRNCPVKLPRAGKDYLVHTEAAHSSGTRFEEPYDLGHGLQLEASVSDPRQLLYDLGFLLHQCGEDSSHYGVESG